MIRNTQIFDESVDTRTIATDTVIPADIDETQAYNFSDKTSTMGYLRASCQIKGLAINIAVGSTNTTTAWNYITTGGTFSGVPTVSLTWLAASGTAEAPYPSTISASSITITVAQAKNAGTINVIGIYGY